MRSSFLISVLACAGCAGDSGFFVDEKPRTEVGAPDEWAPTAEEPREETAVTETTTKEKDGDRPAGDATAEPPCESGAWTVELVDASPEADWYVALALDEHERPHLTYQHGTSLAYTRRAEGGEWMYEVVNLGGIGAFTSLAVDSANRVHVGVQVGNITYASRDADGWWDPLSIVPSEPGAYTGWASAIALDGNGGRHMSFYLMGAEYASSVAYVYDGPDPAAIEIVGEAGTADDYTAVTVDVGGRPHLAWGAYTSGYPGQATVYYARQTARGAWETETVFTEPRWGELQVEFALDELDEPHLAFAGQIVGLATTTTALRHAERVPDFGWLVEEVDPAGLTRPSIAIDGEGTIHLTYFHDGFGRVRYARRETGGEWGTEDFFSEPTGTPSSVAVAPGDGAVHAAFYAEGVRYATRCP